jgi:hypothetical protein
MTTVGVTVTKSVEYYCEFMHNVYEEAAVVQGWATNPRSAKPWSEVPEANKATMRVAVQALLEEVQNEVGGIL